MIAAKYSPRGNRIATATGESVRVWDSNGGHLLVDIPVKVDPAFDTGLLWSNNHLFVISDDKIKQLGASTGSTVSEWQVPGSNGRSCIALLQHGQFFAHSSRDIVTFWDTATPNQLGLIQHPEHIRSIAVSPDDRFLAIGGEDGKITINSLSQRITASIFSRWIVVHVNNFLASLAVFLRSIQFLCLVYTPHSKNQAFGLTTLCSTLGSTINSQTRKHC